MPDPIFVTRAIVPDFQEYSRHIEKILATGIMTNDGEYVRRLEKALTLHLDIPYLSLCSNGTLSLILALRAANLQGVEVITTPFSYVASVSALLWGGYTPVFADIDEETLCLDPRSMENAFNAETAAVLPVHIYGNACDVEAIGDFASAHGLRLIYDGAQAFGSKYNGKTLLSYGDFSIGSFHATKVFHTVEGGCVIAQTKAADEKLRLLRAFGHVDDTHYSLGINAKMTEPHAAMGLCLLGRVSENIAGRKRISEMYDALLTPAGIRRPRLRSGLDYNYGYYPIIFDSEAMLLNVVTRLNRENIFPRRYFYPALNTLPYLTRYQPCPVAESVAPRVLCLPLYAELEDSAVEKIAAIVNGIA